MKVEDIDDLKENWHTNLFYQHTYVRKNWHF